MDIDNELVARVVRILKEELGLCDVCMSDRAVREAIVELTLHAEFRDDYGSPHCRHKLEDGLRKAQERVTELQEKLNEKAVMA